MPPRRRTPVAAGRAALARWSAAAAEVATESAADSPAAASTELDPRTVATAVRFTLEELSVRVPGRSVEVRVPPYGAVQCIPGPTHTRGTPPNVVETTATTWLALATGTLTWAEAFERGELRVSGTRADLTAYLPIFPR